MFLLPTDVSLPPMDLKSGKVCGLVIIVIMGSVWD